ncbi:hypothetical protein GGR56DRAFT_676781 [Xylariaceae sp. FL0804]|nr:hypothetical protein GGR56DRAFT_676781 [Xylariaceae sp. FL0804]
MLMSAIQYTWETGSMSRIKKSFLHHKLEAIKFVNEQVQNPATASSDSTVASIVALALAESALGSRETAKAHMDGLAQILGLQDEATVTDGNIFQSLIVLGTGKMSLQQFLQVTQGVKSWGTFGLGAIHTLGSRLRRRIDELGELSEQITVDQALDEVVSTTVATQEISPPHPEVSHARVMNCYLCVFALLPGSDADPFMLSWLVEWLLRDLERDLKTWEEARAACATWVWRDDDFAEEPRVREMWEEAVFGRRIATLTSSRTLSPGCRDRRDFMSAAERNRSISHTKTVLMWRLTVL